MSSKNILLIFLTSLFIAITSSAQSVSPVIDKDFRFVYIAHDVETPVNRLIERIRENKNNALSEYEDVVFYLANGTNPIVVEFNVGNNNQADFEDILLSELNERISHEVNPETDKEKIMEILNRIKVIDNDKNLNYQTLKFNFYVNSDYWTLKNNEAVIAPIFFAYDVPNIKGGRVQYQILEPREDRLPQGDLFGLKNLSNINQFTKTDRVQF